jgi:transglutaminase-like putative cysteine protease
MTQNTSRIWRGTRVAPRQGNILTRLFAAVAVSTFSFALWVSAATSQVPPASKRSSRSFDFSYVVRGVPSPHMHNVRVWVPLPSSDKFQTISEVRLEAPVRVRMRKEKKYGNHYAYFILNSSRIQAPFEIRLTFHVVRYERHLDLASAIDTSGEPPKGLAAYLRADKLVPIDGVIAGVAREQTDGLASPLEKARRIYQYVVSTMHYDQEGSGAGTGDALRAFQWRRGDCADFHSLFIAMARAAGIPARFQIGFLLPEGHEGTLTGYHSWAEFYVHGFGWIPVDAWQAGQDPSRRDDFFGAMDAHRVMISTGRDVAVIPAPTMGPFNYIVYPYIEMDGKPSGNYSIDFFFNDAGFKSATPSVVRRPIFARSQSAAGDRSLHVPS